MPPIRFTRSITLPDKLRHPSFKTLVTLSWSSSIADLNSSFYFFIVFSTSKLISSLISEKKSALSSPNFSLSTLITNGRSISQNLAHLNILVHDEINLLYYEYWTDKQKYFYVHWLRRIPLYQLVWLFLILFLAFWGNA